MLGFRTNTSTGSTSTQLGMSGKVKVNASKTDTIPRVYFVPGTVQYPLQQGINWDGNVITVIH